MVAMSGGVDSTVAAALLKQQGGDPVGVTLKLFAGESSCCTAADAQDARMAAQKLGMRHYVFNYTALFEETVMNPFIQTYLRGETPNPCIACNRYIKFSALLARAQTLHYDALATGHYARTQYDEGSGRWLLRKGADKAKDQSYVLYCLTQAQLERTRFPLGALTKQDVRGMAREIGFYNAQKKESQDICFVPDGDYGAFIERTLGTPLASGPFVTPEGRTLGVHKGAARYTLGQRKGLGLALAAPGYVCAIDAQKNTVTVGDAQKLYTDRCVVRDINLIAAAKISSPLQCKCKVRYRREEQPCEILQTDEDTIEVRFAAPERAVTPGQAAVFYDGDTVVGGGTLAATGDAR
jgi:tRNA-specific 2-thiouridylase